MQLSYRGVRYSQLRETMDGPLDSIEMINSEVRGSYRGHAFHFTYPRHLAAPTQHSTRELTYRGVSYRTTAQGVRVSSPAPLARPVVPHSARPAASVSSFRKVNTSANVGTQANQSGKGTASLTARAVNLAASEYNKIHQRHIQERLQHRIDVARAQGDRQLLHMLEREMQQVG